MTALSIRIPDQLEQHLSSVAKQLDRPKAYLVRQAIAAYLQEMQEDIEDYNDALEALKDNSPNISWEQVQRKCGLLED